MSRSNKAMCAMSTVELIIIRNKALSLVFGIQTTQTLRETPVAFHKLCPVIGTPYCDIQNKEVTLVRNKLCMTF